MKKLAAIVVALGVSLVIILVTSCQKSSFDNPTIKNTTNQQCDWLGKHLKSRLSSLQPKDGQVEIGGRVFQSVDAQTRVVPVGYRMNFPDDHGSTSFTIARIDDDGVVIGYEHAFDHRSFGKNLIEHDTGSFKLFWMTSAPTSAPTTRPRPPVTG